MKTLSKGMRGFHLRLQRLMRLCNELFDAIDGLVACNQSGPARKTETLSSRELIVMQNLLHG